MYRWFRKNITVSMFERLTGVDYKGRMTEMEIDLALKNAYELQQRHDAPFDVSHRSKIRTGVFPAALGAALEDFVEARIHQATFRESLGGEMYIDVDQYVKAEFLKLCEELAKLR
jgi:hypothetical protein